MAHGAIGARKVSYEDMFDAADRHARLEASAAELAELRDAVREYLAARASEARSTQYGHMPHVEGRVALALSRLRELVK